MDQRIVFALRLFAIQFLTANTKLGEGRLRDKKIV